MRRHAFTMKLKPGYERAYRQRHDAIWPALKDALTQAGISDYSIFLDPDTLTLFAVQKQAENYSASAIADHPVVRRWWDHMADIMETHPDNSPVAEPLIEVFHMD